MNDQHHIDDQATIAVIGMACRFPGANDPETFWRNLCEGVESIEWIDDAVLEARGVTESTRRNPNYVPAWAGPEGVDQFDAGFFGMTPSEAECMDPQHRLMLECAHEALERAAVPFRDTDRRIGVFGGIGMSLYLTENVYHLVPDPLDRVDGGFSRTMHVGLGNEKCYAASRISHKLNLKGPSLYLDAACATSLVAVHMACKSLLDFECDAAVAGGAKIGVPSGLGYLYEEGGMTTPVAKICAFDASAQGTMFTSGAGMVVLKRLEDAVRDGDDILGLIRGSAINNDGADKVAFTAPSFDGQRSVILEALAFSDVPAESISYVETHGTGTPLGDPIEIGALTAAYRTQTDRTGYCAIGSLKPNIGHMEAASGVAGLIKAVLALRHRKLPPSLNYERPNPEIDFENSPFHVNTALRDWNPPAGMPRRAGVSSFGVGGTNAHLIVEEYVRAPRQRPSRAHQLLLLSAKTDKALNTATTRLADHLRAHPELDLADVASTLQRGRERFSRRRMLVCSGREDALVALDGDHAALASGVADARTPEIAFLFPGQGAQHLEMARALYENERFFREALDECAGLLRPHLDRELVDFLIPAPEHRDEIAALLEQTRYTQPVLFCVEYALARLWRSWGVTPSAMLGHSLGEYVAACLAGVFTLADAIGLVALRGRLMQSMSGGAMLSVALPENEIAPLLGAECGLAAVNAPRACVIAGSEDAIVQVQATLAARGVDARRLKTSHAFHSYMMDPVLDAFRAAVAAVPRSAPGLRFVSNVTGDWITEQDAVSPDYWAAHLRGAVRFADGVETLLRGMPGVLLLEVGPGRVLSGLARQHEAARGRVIPSLGHERDPGDAQAAILDALGRLWLANAAIDWEGFYEDETRYRVTLPTYAYERNRYWVDLPKGPRGRTQATNPDAVRDVADWFYAPAWCQQPRPAATATQASGWLLFADRGGLGDALADALRARGDQVIRVVAGDAYGRSAGTFTLRADAPEDYERLVGELAVDGGVPQGIVHAWCCDPSGDDYTLAQANGFYSLLYLAQSLGARPDPSPLTLTVLSSGLADVTGTEPLDPLKASVLGPVKVVPQEYPDIACRQIDVPGVEMLQGAAELRGLAGQLVAELAVAPVPGARIALRGAHRWVSQFAPLPMTAEIAAQAQPWRTSATYLITGGLGGLGLLFARELARRYRARLVLTGRQALPPRGDWDSQAAHHAPAVRERIRQVQAMEADGAYVLTLAVDVTDHEGMTAAIEQARERFGRIDGVLHCAGIAGGGIVQRKLAAEAEAVLAPKIRGAQVLLDVLQDDPPELVVFHSSLFAVTGGPGQVDYCGANNSLDLLARQLARRGIRALSINWDGWTDVGMAARSSIFGAKPTAERGEAAVREPLSHPLLDDVFADGAQGFEFGFTPDPDRHWVVDEHRMDGRPVMPGTALLEMALAAFRHAQPQAVAVELRDVTFLSPMAVDAEGRTRARLLMTAADGDYGFRIQSAVADGEWSTHALGVITESDADPGRCDLGAMRARCADREWDFAGRERDVLPAGGVLRFGPRWDSVRRIMAGKREAMIDLSLPGAHTQDCAEYRLHPALLDLATGLANGYWLEEHDKMPGEGLYLPFGYQRITVWKPIPASLHAHSVLCTEELGSDSLVLDILLADAEGNMIASIEGFSLRLVQPSVASAPALATPQPESKSRLRTRADGIDPVDGIDAMARILGYGPIPQVIVSTRDLAAVIEVMHAPPQTGEAQSQAHNDRPDLGNEAVPPRNETERTLVGIWQSLLGMKEVGIHDNFFELGGDSLLATQLPNRIRSELEVGIDLAAVFRAPTIAQLAEHVDAKSWASEVPADEADETREVGTL